MRFMISVLFLSLIVSFSTYAARTTAQKKSICNVLKAMNSKTLDSVYSAGTVEVTPQGRTFGCIIGWPKMILNAPITLAMRGLWQGKTFYPESETLRNNIVGFKIVPARVYIGASLSDKNDAIIIDYSVLPFPLNSVRDEVRQIYPGVYLGKAYVQTKENANVAARFALIQ